jgi:hypothetical protein
LPVQDPIHSRLSGGLDLAEHVVGGLGIHAIHPIREWIDAQYPNE